MLIQDLILQGGKIGWLRIKLSSEFLPLRTTVNDNKFTSSEIDS